MLLICVLLYDTIFALFCQDYKLFKFKQKNAPDGTFFKSKIYDFVKLGTKKLNSLSEHFCRHFLSALFIGTFYRHFLKVPIKLQIKMLFRKASP